MTKSIDLSDNISANAKKLCAESEKNEAKENPSKAVALLEEALADSPRSITVITKLSQAYRRSGSTGKAIKLLENALADNSSCTRLEHLLAGAYSDRKWGKKAIAQYTKCIDSSDIYPELVQDFSEFMLDSGEHDALISKLCELAEKSANPFEPDIAAMCMAMLYSAMGDCVTNGVKTELTADYLSGYLAKYPCAANKDFFTRTIKNLSETPNDISIKSFSDKLIKTMAAAVPAILSDNKFLNAVADFESSLILFGNDVTELTLLAMRTAKLKFASPDDDKDNLRYLVFDAKMTIVDVLRKGSVDTEKFSEKYPYLWTLISDFVLGASNTRDLKNFAREEIYGDLKNASPRLMKILEENINPDGFAALKKFLDACADAVKGVKSSKISPNSPCPCGSGKKYKKCCGLK